MGNIIIQENKAAILFDAPGLGDTAFEKKQEITVQRNGRLTFVASHLGTTLERQLAIVLEDGAEVQVLAVFAGSGDDAFAIDIRTEHKGKGSKAHTLLHGVLVERAKADFKGLIKILPSGSQTNAFLEERVLVLSDQAKSESLPSLEIEAQDVKASHAATTGKLDESALFYAQARGLPRAEAGRMLIEGFLRAPFLQLEKSAQEKLFVHFQKYLQQFPLPAYV